MGVPLVPRSVEIEVRLAKLFVSGRVRSKRGNDTPVEYGSQCLQMATLITFGERSACWFPAAYYRPKLEPRS